MDQGHETRHGQALSKVNDQARMNTDCLSQIYTKQFKLIKFKKYFILYV